MSSDMPLSSVQGLKCHLETSQGLLQAVNHGSVDLKWGEIYGIVGESGSGKSVTALSILRLLPPTVRIKAGNILFHGTDLLLLDDHQIRSIRGKRISRVFQDELNGAAVYQRRRRDRTLGL